MRHGKIPEPLLIRGNDEPGRVGGAATRERIFVGRGVIVPIFSFLEIRLGNLPVFVAIVDALEEPLLLFVLTDVQKEFQNLDVVLMQHGLELVDLLVAA